MPDASRATFTRGRHARAIPPLLDFALRSSWGIGEIADLPLLARWMTSAGLDFGASCCRSKSRCRGGQSSPYSGLSATAIDPIFIAVEQISDFIGAGGLAALGVEAGDEVESPRCDRACTTRPSVPRSRAPSAPPSISLRGPRAAGRRLACLCLHGVRRAGAAGRWRHLLPVPRPARLSTPAPTGGYGTRKLPARRAL